MALTRARVGIAWLINVQADVLVRRASPELREPETLIKPPFLPVSAFN